MSPPAPQAQGHSSTASTERFVLPAAFGIVALFSGLRAWALYPSWFYADDYRFLADATNAERLTWGHLATPFDNQFMPLGRLIAWTAGHNGHLNWTLVATVTFAFSLASLIACLWMLLTLFGRRWGVVVLLSLYATSAILMPATMWWSAALNQLPWQVAFFLAVGAWVRYLRSKRLLWLGLSALAVLFGITAYIKALLIPLIMAYVMLAYFCRGGLPARVVAGFRTYWPAAIVHGGLGSAFFAYYVTQVPQVFEDRGKLASIAAPLADEMLARNLMTGLVGGPWNWGTLNLPVATADPPAVGIGIAWAVVVLVALALFTTRTRTLRAWPLLLGSAAAAYLVLLTSRAQIVGAFSGSEYRYLSEMPAIVALCLGLASMQLHGAVESSLPRESRDIARPSRGWPILTVCGVVLGGIFSSVHYAHLWHDGNRGASYVAAIRASSLGEPTDMAAQMVPTYVLPALFYPYSSTTRFLPLISADFRFPDSTSALHLLDESGTLNTARPDPVVMSEPGPVANCGWKITGPATVPIRMDSTVRDLAWWAEIDYLAGESSALTVATGDHKVFSQVQRGVNTLYVQIHDDSDSINITVHDPGVVVCIDSITVGPPEPEGPSEH